MSKSLPLLDSPRRRFARGKQHIRRLEKRIATFFKKGAGERFSETDAQGNTTHGFRFARKIPDSWADAGAEAIEALRSALDQCGYAVAVRSGVAEPKNAYFPFGDTSVDLDAITNGRCRDLPQPIRALFRSFDARKEGNYALWALNKLCNANKHRLLVPVGVAVGGAKINHASLKGPVAIPVPTYDREKNQIVLGTAFAGGQFNYDIELSFVVAFDSVNGVEGGPAVGILDAIASEVDGVIRATEAECERLGLS